VVGVGKLACLSGSLSLALMAVSSAPVAAQTIDLTPPTITVPADVVTDATSAAGAQVFYVVTVTNNVAPEFLSCTGPSGAVYPVGTTPVTCVATDVSGNFASKTFNITVRPGAPGAAVSDATSLVLGTTLPNATKGTLIVLLSAIASPPTSRKCDKMDPTKSRPDQVNTKLGNRDTCFEKGVADAQHDLSKFVREQGGVITPTQATDITAAGSRIANTTLTGVFNTPPALALAGDVTTHLPPPEFQAAGATSVLYTGPCQPPSGMQFPVGTTTVTCTAQNLGGTTVKTFTVTVR